jgi:hypothetical protein
MVIVMVHLVLVTYDSIQHRQALKDMMDQLGVQSVVAVEHQLVV